MLFFVLFFGTWMTFAIFSGGAVAMSIDDRRSSAQRSFPVIAVMLGALNCLAALGHGSWPSGLIDAVFGLGVLLSLFGSVIAFWGLQDRASRIFRLLSLLSLALASFWFCTFTFVVPVMWGPPGVFGLIQLGFAIGVWAVAFGSAAVFCRMRDEAVLVRRRSWWGGGALLAVAGLLVLAFLGSIPVQSMLEAHRHQRSMDLYRDMLQFGNDLKTRLADSDADLFPADVHATSASDYLVRFHPEDARMAVNLDLSRVRIANVGRADPSNTVLLRSDDDECQVNIFMNVVGAAPHYPRGSFAMSKDGSLWFYQRAGEFHPVFSPPPQMIDPPRSPAFLPAR